MKHNRTVIQAKRYGIFSCKIDLSLHEAAQRLVQEEISALVVVDDDETLVGIITYTDLLRAYLDHDDWAAQSVGDHMSRQVFTVTPNDKLSDVARLLLDQHVHRAVVVRTEPDGRRRPVAVVSDSDLVYHMAQEE